MWTHVALSRSYIAERRILDTTDFRAADPATLAIPQRNIIHVHLQYLVMSLRIPRRINATFASTPAPKISDLVLSFCTYCL